MKKTPGRLVFLGDDILPSYVGTKLQGSLLNNQDSMESKRVYLRASINQT